MRYGLWDRPRQCRVMMAASYFWDVAHADAAELLLLEYRLRPDLVLRHRFIEALQSCFDPEVMKTATLRDRISLTKLVHDLRMHFLDSKKTPKKDLSINEMRKQALRLVGDGEEAIND